MPLGPATKHLVLGDRQRLDITYAAAVEIPGGRVVPEVLETPWPKRREHEQPEDRAGPGVRSLGREQRTVHAVMEHDEDPDQEPGGRYHERNHKQRRDASIRYIATHSARYAPAEVAMSSNPRLIRGWV